MIIVAYIMLLSAIAFTVILILAAIRTGGQMRYENKDRLIMLAFCLLWCITVYLIKHFG